jgi:hypothetical protein
MDPWTAGLPRSRDQRTAPAAATPSYMPLLHVTSKAAMPIALVVDGTACDGPGGLQRLWANEITIARRHLLQRELIT